MPTRILTFSLFLGMPYAECSRSRSVRGDGSSSTPRLRLGQSWLWYRGWVSFRSSPAVKGFVVYHLAHPLVASKASCRLEIVDFVTGVSEGFSLGRREMCVPNAWGNFRWTRIQSVWASLFATVGYDVMGSSREIYSSSWSPFPHWGWI